MGIRSASRPTHSAGPSAETKQKKEPQGEAHDGALLWPVAPSSPSSRAGRGGSGLRSAWSLAAAPSRGTVTGV